MRFKRGWGVLFLLIGVSGAWAQENFDVGFSTYMGGSNWEHARDVFVDGQGNIYIVGGTASTDFPTTAGAYSRALSTGNDPAFGPCDAFVCKFGPDGQLIWSTYLGGPGYDRAYGVEVDSQGYVYVSGRAGQSFPVKNAFQPAFDGVDNGSYGMQNAFAAKILPDGSDLVWASYVGVSTLSRDLAIDDLGDVYVTNGRWNTTKTPPAAWYQNAYQPTPPGGTEECGVVKIAGDGSQVLWATWLGGSGDDSAAASIRVDSNRYVYVGGSTYSDDFPTTQGAADRTYGGGGAVDFFVVKLSPDGSTLEYGTYLGGDGHEWISTHNLAVDSQGYAYAAFPTGSSDFVTTPGAFQSARSGTNDWGVVKLSPTGALVASTLIGGNGNENADGIYVDGSGNVYISGQTDSTDFPITPATAFQAVSGGNEEAVLVRLSADFSQVLYGTYMGGPNFDNGRSGFLDGAGNLYVTGSSDGTGWPTHNAYQSQFAGGGGSWGSGDAILAKFSPAAPSPGALQFSASGYVALEGGPGATITVTRAGGSAGAVSVDYAAGDGTATGGSDYTAASGTLDWADGESADKTFQVAVLDDAEVEGDETVNLGLSNPTGGASLGGPSAAVLTIQDDEACSPNLLTDPGFENGGTGWQKTTNGGRSIVNTEAHSGAYSQQMVVSDQWPREVYQDVAVTAGDLYQASGFIKTSGVGGNGALVELLWLDATGVGDDPSGNLIHSDSVGAASGTAEWRLVSGSFAAPTGALSVRFRLWVYVDPDNAGTAWFDDARLCPPAASVCADGDSRPCYTGPVGTRDVGECRAGTETCAAGAWGPCQGEVTPVAEDCSDGLDNDCDDLTDTEDTQDCGGEPDGGGDAGVDAGGDAAGDAGVDAGVDAGADPGADRAADGDGGGNGKSSGCSCGSSSKGAMPFVIVAALGLLVIRRRTRGAVGDLQV